MFKTISGLFVGCASSRAGFARSPDGQVGVNVECTDLPECNSQAMNSCPGGYSGDFRDLSWEIKDRLGRSQKVFRFGGFITCQNERDTARLVEVHNEERARQNAVMMAIAASLDGLDKSRRNAPPPAPTYDCTPNFFDNGMTCTPR